jgi:hypothetical protein
VSEKAIIVSPKNILQELQARLLNKNKPVLQHVQTHKIPFSRHIAEGNSWSDVSYIHVIHLLQLLTTRTGCNFFANNYRTVIT